MVNQQPISVPVAAKTAPVSTQPTDSIQMMTVKPSTPSTQEHHHGHNHARRLRGGGAAKDCFLGAIGCFLCFECCEGCCECLGDIICCPCELCC